MLYQLSYIGEGFDRETYRYSAALARFPCVSSSLASSILTRQKYNSVRKANSPTMNSVAVRRLNSRSNTRIGWLDKVCHASNPSTA